MKTKPASMFTSMSWLTIISTVSALLPAYAADTDTDTDNNDVIEEVVATGTYTAESVTTQERDSSAVLDAIGSEQFSRFGDSSAASALKRVSGVSIADGKYAVVRGLNERYTTVTFNGANLPSPDPSRRVVLDNSVTNCS